MQFVIEVSDVVLLCFCVSFAVRCHWKVSNSNLSVWFN